MRSGGQNEAREGLGKGRRNKAAAEAETAGRALQTRHW